MNESFIDKLRNFIAYTDQFQRITCFELSQYFGAYLFLVLIWLCSIPLLFFSAQWIVLPIAAFCIMSSIWYFFDVSLWLPDRIKAISISSQVLKRGAVFIVDMAENLRRVTISQEQFMFCWPVLGPLSVCCLASSAFVVGFAQSHSFLPALSLFLLPIGLLFLDVYIAVVGCLLLFVEAYRVYG